QTVINAGDAADDSLHRQCGISHTAAAENAVCTPADVTVFAIFRIRIIQNVPRRIPTNTMQCATPVAVTSISDNQASAVSQSHPKKIHNTDHLRSSFRPGSNGRHGVPQRQIVCSKPTNQLFSIRGFAKFMTCF
ncbi:MAG: hypothetical protein K2J51_01050, partial [Alistipes sp.]|nr:hypothetical protein [Alistipes sp.]